MSRHWQWAIPVILLAVAILGARLQNFGLLYALIGLVCVVVIMVAFDKIDEKKYPYILFGIGLAVLYQVTLTSNYLIGTDIHYEYWWAYRTYIAGFWDYEATHTYNAAAITTSVFPFIARALHIPLVWTFKVIPPLFLAGALVLMYHMFKQQISGKGAFIAIFFFVTVPTFSLEVTGIAKQQIAEFFFVLFFLMLVDRKLNIGIKKRAVIMLVALVLTIIAHYTMGGALWYYSIIILGFLLIMRFIPYMKLPTQFPLRVYIPIIIISLMFGVWYWGAVAGGYALKEVVNRGIYQAKVVQLFVLGADGTITIEESPTETRPAIEDKQEGAMVFIPKDPVMTTPLFKQYEPTMRAALGLDFLEASSGGKIFRILQFITQILLVLGCVLMIKNRKRFTAEYLAFAGAGGIVLAVCVFLPSFSPILNASRFYHIALLSIAPAIVIGGLALFRNYKVLVLGLLIPYFIFTSGVVFEVIKSENASTLDIPYSYSLSGTRTSITGVFYDTDALAREWVKKNEATPIYSDMWGDIFLREEMGTRRDDINPFAVAFYPEGSIDLVQMSAANALLAISDENYIFLREWNGTSQKIVRYSGIGLRDIVTYEESGMSILIEDREILFQSGNAKVYSPRRVN